MRIDSCKKCGKELSIFEICDMCKNPTVFECKNCDIQTEKQIHYNCVIS